MARFICAHSNLEPQKNNSLKDQHPLSVFSKPTSLVGPQTIPASIHCLAGAASWWWGRRLAGKTSRPRTRSIADQRCLLTKVSGSQSGKMSSREDMVTCCSPGFKFDPTGVALASQSLTACCLADGIWWSWFHNCQLYRFGQDGTVGSESIVLQVATRAEIYLLGRVNGIRWLCEDVKITLLVSFHYRKTTF